MIQGVIDLQNANKQLQNQIDFLNSEIVSNQNYIQRSNEYFVKIKELEDQLAASNSNLSGWIIKQDSLFDEAIKIKKHSDDLLKVMRDLMSSLQEVPRQNKITRLALSVFNNLKK